MRGDGPNVADAGITEHTALKYSAFFACLRVLAETFASVPIFEYKRGADGDRERTDSTGLYEILHSMPNEEMSAYNLYEAVMYQICLGGNAVCERLQGSYAGIGGLYPLQWGAVEIKRTESGNLVYLQRRADNSIRALSRDQVFHIPGPSANGVSGMSILEFASSAVKLGTTYEKFGQNFYQNGAMPSGYFKHPGFLKNEAYDRLKKDLRERYQGLANAGEPILAEDGLEFTQLTIKPIDAQLIECKKLQIEDICRFCRVPLHLVQNLDKATNNNIEHQSLEFVMYTMLPHFKRAEECINTQLLSKEQRAKGYYFEFNLSGLLRGDAKSMAEAFAVGRQWGWLSVNDIRRLMNMNRIPNGDLYLQPMNMIEAGTEPEPKVAPGTTENPDKDRIEEEIANLIASRGK